MSSPAENRDVVVASADPVTRERLRASLASMRWSVREAGGGAEAMAYLEEKAPEALLVDAWLPDLEVNAFTNEVRASFPATDLLRFDGTEAGGARSARRHELLQALRESARALDGASASKNAHREVARPAPETIPSAIKTQPAPKAVSTAPHAPLPSKIMQVDGLVGQSAPMRELFRLIRLVAPHDARVLIEGETGTGKELVAKALHALSGRAKKTFIVLNCAAIPEALLEAELFGHTRGAFTGAVQSRVGRIEAAHGGTLFLDEIGEMPLSLQAKLLRFLENGELQRVGDNETVRVDVRVLAATHQHLQEKAEAGSFRMDLFHRLAVFPLSVPSLRNRIEDIPALVEHFLTQFARESPRKRLSAEALAKLASHPWPGNVRELGNVLQRGLILAGTRHEIGVDDVLLLRSRK